MKFRNSIFALMLMLFAAFSVQAQENTSPISQGDWMVNLTEVGAQIGAEETSISDLPINATVGYALTDQIVLGAGALQGNEDSWMTSVYGRYYLSSPFFAQVTVNYDSEAEDTQVGLSGGVTGFLGDNDNIYVEPNVQINVVEDWSFEIGVNFGVRF